jgi:hypothetical protein
MTENMFGEKIIRIKGDSYLNEIAQRIYDLTNRQPEVLTGDSMGEINRKIHYAIMLDSGLRNIILEDGIKTADKLAVIKTWYLSKSCPTEEETARALRAMLADDIIRLPASIIKRSEQFKSRISSSLRR